MQRYYKAYLQMRLASPETEATPKIVELDDDGNELFFDAEDGGVANVAPVELRQTQLVHCCYLIMNVLSQVANNTVQKNSISACYAIHAGLNAAQKGIDRAVFGDRSPTAIDENSPRIEIV